MFKTLPTADHQAIQAFPDNTRGQGTIRVGWQLPTVELQIIDTSTLLGETLGEQFTTAFATHDQYPWRRHGNGLMQCGQLQQCFAVITRLWKADLTAMGLKNLSRGGAHGKPG
ncbi:hypothetical protein D3C81_944540 [compost metagenome]